MVINRAVPLFLPAVEISNVIHLILLGAARNLSVFICINVLHAQGLIRPSNVCLGLSKTYILILGKLDLSSSLLELDSLELDHRRSDRRPIWPKLDLPEGHLDLTTCGHSPIKVERLREYLVGYDDETASELLDGFSEGFSLHYFGPRIETDCINLKSVRDNKYEALRLVLEEVQKGRIAGPFDERPIPYLRLNPFGLVPKSDSSFRLIQHLSHPAGESVNDFIDPSLCSVSYSSFDHAVEMISQLGQAAWLGKMDVKSAFRLLKISPNDFQLLGFRLLDKFYVDKVLSLGSSISCSLFEIFSTFLEWLLKKYRGKIRSITTLTISCLLAFINRMIVPS